MRRTGEVFVLGKMPFVVPAGAENVSWVKAILAKKAEHSSRPEGIEVGRWTAVEWQDLETTRIGAARSSSNSGSTKYQKYRPTWICVWESSRPL